MKNRVLLGMSGGIDSTYAVHALRQMGYEVEGAIIRMHAYTELEEAKASARALSVPLRIIDASDAFEKYVVDGFCSAYRSAQTPNPCIVCNELVKFRFLYEEAKREGFDRIATGHYANIARLGERYAVAHAKDGKKDQTYMLYRLPQDILSMLVFPLGNSIKTEIAAQAKEMKLEAAERSESQEICFVKNENYADFIERRTGSLPKGNFVDQEGRVLGEHEGIIRYTVGQRKGLGISAATRLFVQEIVPERNEIVLGSEVRREESFAIANTVFSGMREEDFRDGMLLSAKIRYNAPLTQVKLFKENDGFLRAHFVEKAMGVTPGQSAVFYQNGVVQFGGIIQKPHN